MIKYVNQLSDEHLTKLYKMFTDSDAEIISLEITRYDDSVELEGIIKIKDDENPGEYIETEDDYSLFDYFVKVYHHTGNVTKQYREYMFKKFGIKYAKEYLFTHISRW